MDIEYLKSQVPAMNALSLMPISGLTRRQVWRHTLPHSVPGPSFLWFVRGNARLIIEGRAIGIGPNVCVTLPAQTAFAIEPGAQTQATFVQIPTSSLLPMPEGVHLIRVNDIGTQGELSGLLDRIAKGQTSGGPGSERAALARLMLVSSMLERLTGPDTAQTAQSASQKLSARFTREVEQCYATGATLNDIGDMLDVTPTHLTRTFKSTCGMTAARYLGDRLMHAARSELIDTPNSAAEIARDLGFSSPAYFSRAFLHHAEETPGKFRNRNRPNTHQSDAASGKIRPAQSDQRVSLMT
ncbi:AraC family transcriptional regulator [Thalassobacter stenotrophicus]|uniref:Methylphosphotriester-DNA--protein-cysteine S-methyltransferase n=2 Tax=Thalassobacter stenotrophicus TaxID=266809 RepID=A0A0P1FG87_9RHOB|nr:AraC family transcriptional regulator [Thalassobacter stenotrophicus]PVZ48024.1 AraC family transcriptional regulator [Thalassobacter stenotrophicus]CUH59008.1 Methylphosphotriester-DNA--protein-cysteine S-methyltransferase [Thalassobacter stenotrophicus]SHJ02546.1 AraC-type DNA-binding protein [Thalassobacter stenotrophicus DSM 16310]